MKKIILLILLFTLFGCNEDTPVPVYQILPVVEIRHPLLGINDINGVRIDIHVSVNGIERPVEEYKLDYWKGRQCPLIKAAGTPIIYEGISMIKMWVTVYFRLEEQEGWILVTNFDPTSPYYNLTYIRLILEVRDKNDPTDKFIGVEKLNNPTSDDPDIFFPIIEWQIGDTSGVPQGISQSSPDKCDCEELK